MDGARREAPKAMAWWPGGAPANALVLPLLTGQWALRELETVFHYTAPTHGDDQT